MSDREGLSAASQPDLYAGCQVPVGLRLRSPVSLISVLDQNRGRHRGHGKWLNAAWDAADCQLVRTDLRAIHELPYQIFFRIHRRPDN